MTTEDWPMPNCTNDKVTFGRVGRRVVEAAFDGGDIASDGGAMLLRQVDQRIGLTRAAAPVFNDARRPASIKHGMREHARAAHPRAVLWLARRDRPQQPCAAIWSCRPLWIKSTT